MPKFHKGEKVVATAVRGLDTIKHGDILEVVDPEAPSIYPDRPLITVRNENGKTYSLHEHRFSKYEGK